MTTEGFLKKYIKEILFVFAVVLFFTIDLGQNAFERGSEIRKMFYFTGNNLVQFLFSVIFILSVNKYIKIISFSWMAYLIECIYSRIFSNSDFEISDWIITISITIICIIYILLESKIKRIWKIKK